MSLSPRPSALPGTPRPNHSIDQFADHAATAGLLALSHELRGRPTLASGDFAEIERRIAARHAALDRLSIDLEYNRGAMLNEAAHANAEAQS